MLLKRSLRLSCHLLHKSNSVAGERSKSSPFHKATVHLERGVKLPQSRMHPISNHVWIFVAKTQNKPYVYLERVK